MTYFRGLAMALAVASYTDAWIETTLPMFIATRTIELYPVRVCGLKHQLFGIT